MFLTGNMRTNCISFPKATTAAYCCCVAAAAEMRQRLLLHFLPTTRTTSILLLVLILLVSFATSFLVIPPPTTSPPRIQRWSHHHHPLSLVGVVAGGVPTAKRRRPSPIIATPPATRVLGPRPKSVIYIHQSRVDTSRLWNDASSSSSPSYQHRASSSWIASFCSRIPSFLHFPIQLAILLACYAFHLTVLSQHVLALPVELWDGGISSIGYDSIVGMLVGCFWYFGYNYRHYRRRQRYRMQQQSTSDSTNDDLPWKLLMDDDNNDYDDNMNAKSAAVLDQAPSSTKTSTASTTRKIPWPLIRFRFSFVTAAALLVKTYFQTGRLSLFWEDLLYELSAAGWPLTTARMRSLQVLLGHLSWVAAGSIILWLVPRPPSFFASFRRQGRHNKNYRWFRVTAPWASSSSSSSTTTSRNRSRYSWLWWTLGGYLVSSWLFNVADTVNQFILPAQVLRDAAQAESVVTQLVRPEYNDMAALWAGYLAPCVSAPVWEEVLYRGFLLSGLHAVTGSFTMATLVQAVVFSAHHMSVTGALPLAVLGATWAVLYAQSRNLWTVVAVHALWNSRVFLGSWLGL